MLPSAATTRSFSGNYGFLFRSSIDVHKDFFCRRRNSSPSNAAGGQRNICVQFCTTFSPDVFFCVSKPNHKGLLISIYRKWQHAFRKHSYCTFEQDIDRAICASRSPSFFSPSSLIAEPRRSKAYTLKESRKRLARVDQEHPKAKTRWCLPSWPDLRWRWKRLLQTSSTTSFVGGGHLSTCRTEPVSLNKSGICTKIYNSCVFFALASCSLATLQNTTEVY